MEIFIRRGDVNKPTINQRQTGERFISVLDVENEAKMSLDECLNNARV